MLKVIVAGGRNFTDYDLLKQKMKLAKDKGLLVRVIKY